MCSKTIAEALADALPVDGYPRLAAPPRGAGPGNPRARGPGARGGGGGGPPAPPLDRGDTATISSEEDRMDVTNNMNVDPSSISRRSLVLRSTSEWRVNTMFKLDI